MIFADNELPLLERIQKYRDMAADAQGKADAANSPTARSMYLVLAKHWEALATEAEARRAESE